MCVCAGLVKPVLDGLLKRQATEATDAVLLVRHLLSPSPCSCRLSSSFTCKYGPTPTPRVPGTVGPECRRTKPPGAGILVAIWDASAECLKKFKFICWHSVCRLLFLFVLVTVFVFVHATLHRVPPRGQQRRIDAGRQTARSSHCERPGSLRLYRWLMMKPQRVSVRLLPACTAWHSICERVCVCVCCLTQLGRPALALGLFTELVQGDKNNCSQSGPGRARARAAKMSYKSQAATILLTTHTHPVRGETCLTCLLEYFTHPRAASPECDNIQRETIF